MSDSFLMSFVLLSLLYTKPHLGHLMSNISKDHFIVGLHHFLGYLTNWFFLDRQTDDGAFYEFFGMPEVKK